MKNGKLAAYPQCDYVMQNSGKPHEECGLTKRERFALEAMQGILSNPALVEVVDTEWISKESTKQADALLKELEETPE